MNFICTYNLESKQDVQNLRMKYIEEVTPLKAERGKLRQLYKKATNEADKTIIQAKIDILTERIITKAEKGEKETILINNRVSENQLNSEHENSLNKHKNKNKQELIS